jgi:hypothetical protein
MIDHTLGAQSGAIVLAKVSDFLTLVGAAERLERRRLFIPGDGSLRN